MTSLKASGFSREAGNAASTCEGMVKLVAPDGTEQKDTALELVGRSDGKDGEALTSSCAGPVDSEGLRSIHRSNSIAIRPAERAWHRHLRGDPGYIGDSVRCYCIAARPKVELIWELVQRHIRPEWSRVLGDGHRFLTAWPRDRHLGAAVQGLGRRLGNTPGLKIVAHTRIDRAGPRRRRRVKRQKGERPPGELQG